MPHALATHDTADIAIRARGMTRRFGDLVAVNQVSLEVPGSSVYGFLGPNGSEKSTMIRMFCGLLTPNAGQIVVLGLRIPEQAEHFPAINPAIRVHVSVRRNAGVRTMDRTVTATDPFHSPDPRRIAARRQPVGIDAFGAGTGRIHCGDDEPGDPSISQATALSGAGGGARLYGAATFNTMGSRLMQIPFRRQQRDAAHVVRATHILQRRVHPTQCRPDATGRLKSSRATRYRTLWATRAAYRRA